MSLEVFCSKGTYIRSLAEDIGAYFGCGATVAELRRLQAGVFHIENALTIEQLRAMDAQQLDSWLLEVDTPLQTIPAVELQQPDAGKVRNGQSIKTEQAPLGQVRMYHAGAFLGLGEMRMDGKLAPFSGCSIWKNQAKQSSSNQPVQLSPLYPIFYPQSWKWVCYRPLSGLFFNYLNISIGFNKMPYTAEQKKKIVEEYRLSETDTGSLLERVEANLQGRTAANGQPVWTSFVTDIDYDAKGQRTRIDYGTRDGKGVTTTYEYDPDTFRLIHLKIRRKATGFDGTDRPGEVQNLHYTYDPAGNITHIHDDAQQTVFFKGQIIEPSNDYSYDGIYRLIEATGREHLGQLGGSPIPHSYNDAGRVGVVCADAGRFAPNDQNAMGRYCEKYVYDAVGNFEQMSHHRSCLAAASWRRTYFYEEASLIEPAKQSNRPEPHRGRQQQPDSWAVRLRPAWQHDPYAAVADHAMGLQGPAADDPAAKG